MPTRRLRLSKAEMEEHRTRLLRLKRMGIQVGCPGDPLPQAGTITLEETDYEEGRLWDLPFGKVLIIVSAKLTVLGSGILIADAEMTIPWDDSPLDLSEPEALDYYQDQHLISSLYHSSPNILNCWLMHHVPIRPRQEEGLIVATGRSPVPATCEYPVLIPVKLLLRDQRGNELHFDFGAELDRSAKRKHEWQQGMRSKSALSTKRVPIFQREDLPLGDGTSVPPRKAPGDEDE
jgi:hypothetical protein